MSHPVDLAVTYESLVEREARWHENQSTVWGLPTPWHVLNRKTGGLHPGFIALGARTSHGKSAMAMQMALHTAEQIFTRWMAMDNPGTYPPEVVLIFSPEMNADELMERYASYSSGVPSELIKTGKATQEQRNLWLAQARVLKLMMPVIRLYAGEILTFDDILEIIGLIHRETAAGGPRIALAVLDYLQIIPLSDVGISREYAALSMMANKIKQLANKHKIPILVASQLNRSIERDRTSGDMVERPPELSDFHGSGAIEAACDMAILLWRPPESNSDDDDLDEPAMTGQKAKIYIKKNRHGRVGECELEYFPDIVRFDDPFYIRQRRRNSQEAA